MGSRSGRLRACAALLCGLVASPAAALNMTVGDVSVIDLSSYGFEQTSSELSFDGVAGDDELYQLYGFLGTRTGTPSGGVVPIDSTNFDIVTGISAVGNVATSQLTLNATGAGVLGLSTNAIELDYTFTLTDRPLPDDYDRFAWDITLRNTTLVDIDVVFYTYVDLDINGSGDWADDLASANYDRIVASDNDDPTDLLVFNVTGAGSADHYEVGAYATVRTNLEGMAVAQDLSDGGVPFGPDDFTGAFQFDRTLLAGGGTAATGVNVTFVPEPDSAILTAIGLMGLAFYGRRVGPGMRRL